MSLIRKHGAVLQAWACLDLVIIIMNKSVSYKTRVSQSVDNSSIHFRIFVVEQVILQCIG